MRKIFSFLLVLLIIPCIAFAAWGGGKTDRYVVTWSTIVSSTANAAPDSVTLNGAQVFTAGSTDYEIPIARARDISIRTNTALDAGSCTNTAGAGDWSLNVIAKGGTTSEPFDTGTGTAYYWSYDGHADALVVTQIPLSPGPTHIKFRADEDGGNNLCLTTYVTVTFE